MTEQSPSHSPAQPGDSPDEEPSMGVRYRELPGGRTELTFPLLMPAHVNAAGAPMPPNQLQMAAAQASAQLMAAAIIDAMQGEEGDVVDMQEGGGEVVEVGEVEDRNPAQSPQPGAAEAASAGPAAASASPERPRLAVSPSFADMLRYLVGVQGGPIRPPPWANVEWRRLLEMSMADSGGVKEVASEEGLDEIKKWVYKTPEPVEEGAAAATPAVQVCAITQTPFEDGDEVAEMPCGHTFDSDSLMHWLQRESAACPVCRTKVASREVARTPEGRTISAESDSSAGGDAQPPITPDLLQPLLPGGGVRMRIYNPGGRMIRGPQRRLGDAALARTAEIEQQIEDDQIEEAILQAVLRDSLADV